MPQVLKHRTSAGAETKPAADNPLAEATAPFEDRDLLKYGEALGHWLDLNGAREAYNWLSEQGEVRAVKITAPQLRRLEMDQRLHFQEPVIYGRELAKITLPLRPDEPDLKPVILVQFEGGLIIPNGNHRVFKVLDREFNPGDHPLLAVRFSSPAAFEQCTGITLRLTGYACPVFSEFGTRSGNR